MSLNDGTIAVHGPADVVHRGTPRFLNRIKTPSNQSNRGLGELQQAHRAKRGMLISPDDYMVEDFDAQSHAGFNHHLRDGYIGRRGRGIPAWMVVHRPMPPQ